MHRRFHEPRAAPGTADGGNAAGLDQLLPEILRRIRPPKFPDRDFDIRAYGARGDGAGPRWRHLLGRDPGPARFTTSASGM